MNSSSSVLLHFFQQADTIDRTVLVVLALMSIGSWFLILQGIVSRVVAGRQTRQTLALVQGAELPESGTCTALQGDLAHILRAGLASLEKWKASMGPQQSATVVGDPVERALDQALADNLIGQESGLTYLACVAAAAPFIGLFGTVMGIYHALEAIGSSGEAGLSQVAGPVGEALLMTACGLACAIPAVLAYNFFVRSNRIHLANMEHFAHHLHSRLTLGAD